MSSLTNSLNKPSSSTPCSRANGPRSRPQSTPAIVPTNGGQPRSKPPTSNGAAINKNAPISGLSSGLNKNDSADNTKKISDLSNLKGIDKRIIELILDNIYTPNTKITFDDISGLDAAKQALREIGK